MKIAFVAKDCLLNDSESYIKEISKRMAKKGHNVFVYISKQSRNKIKNENLKFIEIPSENNLFLAFATIHIIFSNFEIVHFHRLESKFLISLLKLLKPKTAVIVSEQNPKDYKNKSLNNFTNFFLYFAFQTMKFSKEFIKFSKDALVNENGNLQESHRRIDISKENVLAKHGLKEGKYIFISEKIEKKNDIHFLIEAFKLIEDTSRMPNNFKLVIAGELETADDYGKYISTISENRESILFVGKLNSKTFNQFLSKAYLFIQESSNEEIPNAFLEAVKEGVCPLINKDKNAFKEIDDMGLTFESKNILDIRDKLAFFLSRPDKTAKLCRKAQKFFEKNFSWDSITDNTLNIYKELIDKAK